MTTLPLTEEIVGNSRAMLVTILGAVAALLLIACVNLAEHVMARAAARQRELAVRSALGATRGHLIRLLLVEAAVLAIGGGALGFLLATWGSSALVNFVPANMPRIHDLAPDMRVLVFTAATILLATIVCGLAPAWLLSRTDLRDALASGGRGSAGGATQSRGACLVGGQVALAMVLLAGAGLFLRSFSLLSKEGPGFDPRNVLTVRPLPPAPGFLQSRCLRQVLRKTSATPRRAPGRRTRGTRLAAPDESRTFQHPVQSGQSPRRPEMKLRTRTIASITSGYISAMRIPFRNGHKFTEEDVGDRPPVVIISGPLAPRSFSPIVPSANGSSSTTLMGHRVPSNWGVIGEVRQEKLELPATFDIYLPLRQATADSLPFLRNYSFWVLRTWMTPTALQIACEPRFAPPIRPCRRAMFGRWNKC